MLPWSNQSFNPKWHLDLLSHFAQLTTELPFPSKLPVPMWESGPHLIHGSLCPPDFTSQNAPRSVQLFVDLAAECPYTLQWPACFSPLPQVSLDRRQNHGGPGNVPPQKFGCAVIRGSDLHKNVSEVNVISSKSTPGTAL